MGVLALGALALGALAMGALAFGVLLQQGAGGGVNVVTACGAGFETRPYRVLA